MVKKACQKGANPNQTIFVYDGYDQLIEDIKPIDLAMRYKDSETVKLLLDQDNETHKPLKQVKEDL